MFGWISEAVFAGYANSAGLSFPQHFARADALQAKIEMRIDMGGFVGEEPELFQKSKTELHRDILSGRMGREFGCSQF